MQFVFTKNNLHFSLSRNNDNSLLLAISSEFSGSQRKSQLHLIEVKFSFIMERFWKDIRSNKIRKAHLSFSEIDHYDDMTDIFEVPNFSMERGLRNVRIGSDRFGSIPKEWAANLNVVISDTKTIGPILETVELAARRLLTEDQIKAIIKAFRPVLQRKKNSGSFQIPYEN
jgi:hypothetical protein